MVIRNHLCQAAKRLLEEYQATPVCINARYACAYSTIKKRDWWDLAICGGPIVEQATHFLDLMRYFAGEIAPESIKAVAVGPSLPLSDMPEAPEGEHSVISFFLDHAASVKQRCVAHTILLLATSTTDWHSVRMLWMSCRCPFSAEVPDSARPSIRRVKSFKHVL